MGIEEYDQGVEPLGPAGAWRSVLAGSVSIVSGRPNWIRPPTKPDRPPSSDDDDERPNPHGLDWV